ncbi:thermosome subunit beta [Hyperthermus butylicus]|uniref:Thermosome subunit beta n=1 Tax=Hyperthermus butylicus (strain DSM 5456 / JCM 9403 / PLM1-5) TaxID=415426 RepID=A2BK32_HYPBU|nr:thermosome subunit beta [Hyperthermus butylicus]ABM80343.1 Thermosome beta subunit [Hyperthermus butylicus DSM 5456]
MSARQVAALEPTGVPVLILKEGTQRTYGREALRTNIMIVRAIAETLRTTYGPKGMDKMLVDSLGDITITNDGATILDKMDVQHPTAKLVVQIAKGQDEEVGDGTKTAVIFAGELLRYAEELLDKNVHPTIIVSGYKKAAEEAVKKLHEIAEPIDINDEETLKKIAMTSLTSKAVHGAREHLAEIVVKAVRQVAEKRGDKWYIDLDAIQIIKKHGGSLRDTKLIYGIVLDKEVVHPGMPKKVENAYIVLLDAPLEVEKPEIDAEIRINDPAFLKKFLEEEEKILEEMVNKIYNVAMERIRKDGMEGKAGIVVITQKGIDEVAQHFLAKKGIMAVRRVKRSDIEKIARATGAKIVSNIDDLTPEDLGFAKLVEERKVGEDKMVFIEGCPNPRAVTILIRGGLERLVDEAERSINDALHAVADAIRDGKIVAGGGAVEVEVAKYLREIAPKIGGKEQLAVEAFARALEGLPMALAENAGLEPVEIIMKLRAAHAKAEGKWVGVNVFKGDVDDMKKLGVIEPVSVKANAIKAGTEAATMVLRIDDIIAAARREEKEEEKKKGEEEEKEEKEE